MISENFSDLTIFVLRYTETCSAISFFSISIARFFSFIPAISSRNFGSKSENPFCTSEKRLITPSLFILCFSNSLIRAFILSRDNFCSVPPLARRTSTVRTASKKAASRRVSSSTKLAHKERACRSSKDSLMNFSLVSLSSIPA